MARAVYLNRIATAVPAHDIHAAYLAHAPRIVRDPRAAQLFRRMAARSQIAHRYSVLAPGRDNGPLDAEGFYLPGAYPTTGARMALFERHAAPLALAGVRALGLAPAERPSHLVITCCTGFSAPGLDLAIADALALPHAERTMVGFMGCAAAIAGLKLAYHIVRSEPDAKVLLVNVELCTLHLQETDETDALLCYLLFADGCAASLLSAEHAGVELLGFASAVLPASTAQITWRIGDRGFAMELSGAVLASVARVLPALMTALAERCALPRPETWAVHPGGRSVLDAVEQALGLPAPALAASRRVLRDYGNMSSPTVMFVLKALLEHARAGATGAALAFGPGLSAEAMGFRIAGPSG